MRRTILYLALSPVVMGLMLGSCKHQVEITAPKEPIRVEVKLDIHIYEHARKDIDFITGGAPPETEKKPPAPPEQKESGAGNVLLHLLGVGVAYAETTSDQDQLKTVLNSMRKRYPTLARYKADKSIGENYLGYVEERPSEKMSDGKYAQAVRATIAAENADRRLLYQIRAQMDGTTLEKQAAIYAKVWRDAAKPGEWIEVIANNKREWKPK